jgi:hypothetical protein
VPVDQLILMEWDRFAEVVSVNVTATTCDQAAKAARTAAFT